MAFVLKLNDADDRRLRIAAAHLGVSKTEFAAMAIEVAIKADDEMSRMVMISDRMEEAKQTRVDA